MKILRLECLIEDAKKEFERAATVAQQMYAKGKVDAYRNILGHASEENMFTVIHPDGEQETFKLKKR
jgi:hypothetical protein